MSATMRRGLILLIALVFSSAQPTEAQSPHRGTKTQSSIKSQARLVVSDATTTRVRLIDLASGKVLANFNVKAPARLHTGASGRYVYAVQSDAGTIAVVDTGIATESHGDHDDIKITRPRLLPISLSGPRPSHVTHDQGRVAAFFDGDGTAQVFLERGLADGKLRTVQRLETGAKHHGVAQPIGRQIAVTVPPAGEGLPNAVELRAPDNAASLRMDCPRLHGEGHTGRYIAFGCADGVVVYETGRAAVTARRIGYPQTLPADRMIRNLAGATGFTFLVGDFGADGMVVLDPSAKDGDFRFIPLPARRMHFHLHPDPGDKLFVIVEDGTLIRIDPIGGKETGRIQATNRYSMEQGIMRPRITSAGPYVAVSNPAAGEVVVIDAETMMERRRLKLGGEPFDVVAIVRAGHAH
jgi:hypothetical protein